MHTAIQLFALQQAAVTFPDTVFTKPVGTGVIHAIAVIADVLLATAVFLFALTLFLGVLYFRAIHRRITKFADKIESEFAPLMRTANGIVGDVRDLVGSMGGEVRQVQETVTMVNTRVRAAVRRAEARIERFETLLDLVEEEAAATVVSATAAVRGVRTGLEEMLNHLEGVDDGEDGEYGDDVDDIRTAYDRPTGPRVRPRRDEDDYL